MRLDSIVAAVAGMAAAVLLAVPAGAVSRTAAPGGDRFVLPAPTGPYPVGWDALHLVDRDRPDPWAPHVAVVGEWLGLAIQPLPGARCIEITRSYVAAFLDQHLRQRHQPLLDGPSPRFPEVQFVGTTG